MGMSYRGVISTGVLILGLLSRVGVGAELEPRDFTDEVVQFSDYRYNGQFELNCDAFICKDSPETLVNLAAPRKGQLLTNELLQGVWSRLMKTGYFRDVAISLQRAPRKKVGLYVRAESIVQIERIDIRYDGLGSWVYPKQFMAEIRKRLPLRRGGSFPAELESGGFSPADQRLVDSYAERIVRLYREQGYFGTRVRIKPTYHGDNKRFVDIEIRVKEGEQPPMGQVLIHGGKAYPYWRIADFFSTGERIDLFDEAFGVFGYGKYARKQLKLEAAELESAYHEDGFFAAKVRLETVSFEQDGVRYPKVRISEGRRVRVAYSGRRSLSIRELDETLTFKGSGAVDEDEVEQSRLAILAQYQSIGRYFARVESEILQNSDRLLDVVFHIEEGPRIFVRKVRVKGNRALTDDEIRAQFTIKGIAPNGVINSLSATDGILQDAGVINDLNGLRRHYGSLGFPNLVFRCAPATLKADVWTAWRNFQPSPDLPGPREIEQAWTGHFEQWSRDPVNNHCFRVVPTDDPRLVDVEFEISEGERVTSDRPLIAELILVNMDEQMREEAFQLLEKQGFLDEFRRWRKNVPLTKEKVQSIQGFILRFFHQEGYLNAQVTPRCILEYPGDLDPVDSCSMRRLYGEHVKRLEFHVVKGAKTQTAGILIRGNLKTDRAVIADELLFQPGKGLGTDEIFLSQANLRSLGIFDAVSVQYIRHDSLVNQPTANRLRVDDATVVVSVEEGVAQTLDLYAGIQVDSATLSDELPVLYTVGGSVRDRNFFGSGLELGLGINHANQIEDPLDYLGDSALWQTGPFIKNRRFLGTRLDLTTEALFQLSETPQRDAYQQVFNLETKVGYDFYALSYPSKWGLGLRSTLATELRRERLRALSRNGERPTFGEFTDSLSVTPAITWDQRDSPLHPTRGFFISGSLEFLVPNIQSDLDFPTKLVVASHYVAAFAKRKLIIVPSLKIGSVGTERDGADLKTNFLFKAGGDGVSTPVRGYENASIEACGGTKSGTRTQRCDAVFPDGVSEGDTLILPETIGGHALVSGGLELRFPTFLVADLWGTVFVDFAAVAPAWAELNNDRLFPSVGGGLRYLVTGQIPLRLDLAYPLKGTVFSPQETRVHVNLFYTL